MKPIRPVFDYEAEVNAVRTETRDKIIEHITNTLWCLGCCLWVIGICVWVASVCK
jgi:hypothetical protein